LGSILLSLIFKIEKLKKLQIDIKRKLKVKSEIQKTAEVKQTNVCIEHKFLSLK
jgi:hypothetical protein